METQSNTYDFIVIGSGMGGLTTALVLAKENYRVLVLEKNHQIGGALQVFSRDKCVFDTGVHYIGGLDKGENLYRLFNYLGIYKDLKLQSLDRDCFDKIRLQDGSEFKHGQGYENFAAELIRSFPDEAQAIQTYCAKIQEVCDMFPMYNIEEVVEGSYYENPEILGVGAWDYVCSITTNETLRNVLLANGPLYAGEIKSTPLYVVALITNSYIKGSYRLVDGGSQIAKSLVKRLREHGGEILKHKEVIGAEYDENGAVKAVNCSDGSTYYGKHFISNMHPSLTINIFDPSRFRKVYRDRIQKLENTVSSFMVYFSLKEHAFPYFNYNFYDYYTDELWNTVEYDQSNWPQMMYICTPASSKSADFAESLCVMCYMSIDEVTQWENTFNTIAHPDQRGEDYTAFKKAKEALVIERLEQKFPGFKDAIINVYSSTPLTYKDYIGTPEGSLYGIKKDFRFPEATIVNTKTRISNLYLTGQNIVFHGILGATIGAFVTSFNFVDYKKIIAKIKEYE